MSQEQPAEKKNRFQISREVQEDFVNSVAENMLALAETAGKWQKPWTADAPMGMPFVLPRGASTAGPTWSSSCSPVSSKATKTTDG